jgi:hypothetical protein
MGAKFSVPFVVLNFKEFLGIGIWVSSHLLSKQI